MKKTITVAVIAIAGAGCGSMHGPAGAPGGAMAAATLEPTTGSTAKGRVTFTQMGDRVRVSAQLTGLKPNAEHGFHVHEKGDCSSGDGMSAGGHFNPDMVAHAGQPGHVGDMPNLKADANGIAHAQFESKTLTVAEGPHSIVGKGLIVHRDADDYKTQPTGNAGPRLACSVIQAG